jgi:hypothetical protein
MDHTSNTLRAISKALTDVIAPAVDPKDPLANEQLRLVIDYVGFMRQRLDHLGERELFELHEQEQMASALVGIMGGAAAATQKSLETSLAEGRAVLALPGAIAAHHRNATANLAGAIRQLVREAANFPVEARRAIESRVVEASTAQIMFERAWYLPLGFEPAAGEVPSLAELLAKARSSG